MLKKFYYLIYTLLFINNSNGFLYSNINSLNINKHSLNNNIIYKKKEYKNPINIKMIDKNNFLDFEIFNKIANYETPGGKKIGQILVEKISSTLPYVDNIGHKVLHANGKLINAILDNNILDHSLKKKIILLSIELAQSGDNFGSELLQFYYDLVDKML